MRCLETPFCAYINQVLFDAKLATVRSGSFRDDAPRHFRGSKGGHQGRRVVLRPVVTQTLLRRRCRLPDGKRVSRRRDELIALLRVNSSYIMVCSG